MRDGNKARAGGVQVYGVDDRFWKFHGVSVASPEGNDVLLSPALARELEAKSGDAVLLRIEKPSAIPIESLHGRKDDAGRTIRFTMREELPQSSLGEFSLRAQQGAVRAVFAPLRRLQRSIEQEGKANSILLALKDKVRSELALQYASRILKDRFSLADVGVKLRSLDERYAIVLESESAVINDLLAEKAQAAAGNKEKPGTSNYRAASFLTYLVNTIRIGQRETPYSLITAVTPGYAALKGFGVSAARGEIQKVCVGPRVPIGRCRRCGHQS